METYNGREYAVFPKPVGGLKGLICWCIGHDMGGRVLPDQWRNVSGQLRDGWVGHCKRCKIQEKFEGPFLDRRNVYMRARVAVENFFRRNWNRATHWWKYRHLR